MSTKLNEKNLFPTFIKLENDTDDESSELNNNKDYYSNLSSTSTILNPSLSSAYKGKIEVTSKGRRKIFDGVRWQILCRRPECRKQTNKKSLCITHYKEEYQSNTRSSSSSWSNNLQSFQLPSYQQRQSFNSTKTRSEIEDQNNTITTTNLTDNNEQLSLNSINNRSIHEGQIEYMNNGRRFILKNSKWQPLCKYDNICRNTAKYELLCIKHFQLTQQKRRDTSKVHNNDKQHLQSSIFDKHRSILSNDITKRLKKNDFQISSSSVTEQFDINSNENVYTSNKPVDTDSSSLTSKLPGHKVATSSQRNLNIIPSDYSLFDKQKSEFQNDQSVQTDLTIPWCCIIHQDDHSFFSSCKNNKSTSSILSCNTKSEPQSENKASGYQENIPSLTKILETYHPDDIRILFLSNEFNETIYLDNETLNDAKTFKLSLIKKIADLYKYLSLESTSIELDCTEKYDEIDLILLINFRSIKHNIFSSVCDCINTKQVMVNIDKLLQLADDYVKKETTKINKYLTKNTTRRNCSKVKRLIFNTQIYLSKAVYEYFPSL